jgi:CO/xanthine dehydrogenase FAD-binding subunit
MGGRGRKLICIHTIWRLGSGVVGMSDYARPEGLATALALLSERPRTVLAGGTDLFPVRAGQGLAGPVLDLTAVEDLRGIARIPQAVRIGACATWSEVIAADLPPAFDALKQAAAEVGGRQIQNMGTVAGNLCNASPAADGVPPLLVLEAEVELATAQGERRLPLDQFITGPRRTALMPGEIVTAVIVPGQALAGRSRFLKLGARKYLVISIASVAIRLVEREGVVADAAVAIGACSPVPRRLAEVEAALVGVPVIEAARAVDDAAVAAGLSPVDDIRADAAYRARAAAELIRRAIADLTGVAR